MRARIILPLLGLLALLPLRLSADSKPAYGVRVVVLDAGHGGSDPGANYAGVNEKDLTLKVILRLGRRIEQGMPGVQVVYTRKTDKALAPTKAEDLQKRADIANKAKGDLFISVHVNAARTATAQGTETLIMGETPKEQRYNEEALFDTNRDDLIDMSDERQAAIVRAYLQNLQFSYGEHSLAMARCIQNNYVRIGRQSRGVKPQLLRVLYATNMPGVLTEIGFLSNKEEAAFLKSDKGIDRIVDALYRALQDYSDYLLELRRAEAEAGGGAAASGTAPKPAGSKPAAGAAASKPASKPASDGAGATVSAAAAGAAAGAAAAGAAAAGAAAKPAASKSSAEGSRSESRREERETRRAERRQAKEEVPKLYDPRLYNEAAAALDTPESAKGGGTPAATPAPDREATSAPAASEVRYTVQVLASRRSISVQSSEFKEYRGRVHRYEGSGPFKYRYGVGEYETRTEALQAAVVVRSSFPGAFVTAVRDGQVVAAGQ